MGAMRDYAELFDSSYRRCIRDRGYQDRFVERFYERFLDSSGEVRDYFAATDMARQQRMLRDSLLYVVNFAKTLRDGVYLRQLALRHGRAGLKVPVRLYDLWLDSLVETVAEFDPEYSDDVGLAWRCTLAPGITYMIEAGRRS